MDQEAEGYIDLVADDFLIPARETTYQTFCFEENDLIAKGMPPDTALHGVGIEPIIDARSTPYVHHFIAYGSESPSDCSGIGELAYGWAPGDLPTALPSNVGSPLGKDGF
jgi:hypothetical protein